VPIYLDIDSEDQALLQAARSVIQRNFSEWNTTVGAAVRCGSGKIYAGVNIDSSGFGARAATAGRFGRIMRRMPR
jgi:cytidine deaminase